MMLKQAINKVGTTEEAKDGAEGGVAQFDFDFPLFQSRLLRLFISSRNKRSHFFFHVNIKLEDPSDDPCCTYLI